MMADRQLYTWSFDRSPLDQSSEFSTFSVGIYQWVPNASGTDVKKSKTIRVMGYVADPQAVYAKAEKLCRQLNKEQARVDAPPPWLQKQYSLPEPQKSATRAGLAKRVKVKDRVTQMAREVLGPEMKRLGFCRSGRTFWRNGPAVCQLVTLHMSPWGTSTSSSFDVFLGVFWHQVEEILQNPHVEKMPPPEYQCTFRIDLGWTTPKRLQKSWDANQKTDLALLGRDVLQDFLLCGLPWLEYRSSLEHVTERTRYLRHMARNHYTSHEMLSCRANVVFLTMLGRVAEAEAEMRKWQVNGVWEQNDEKLAKRLGIEP